jgi:hypothetical protein
MTDLGTLGGRASMANGINTQGDIVGFALNSSELSVATLWRNGAATDLNSLVNLPGGTLYTATAINDSGEIVANGNDGNAYLLVPAPEQVIVFGALPTPAYGDAPFALAATATSGLPITTSVVSGPATISGNIVTLTGAGDVTIQAVQAGNGSFLAAMPATETFTAARATPVITWPTPAAIAHGTAISSAQFNASASVPGTFAYSPVPGTVPAIGSTVLTATFTPADTTDYATATLSVTLQVDPPLALSWPTPAAIAYGTPLSPVQLDATANAAGVFSYTPAPGTVLAVGGHVLTATFNPTDTSVYSSATVSVVLFVNAAPIFYVSNATSNSVALIRADGTASTFATGLIEPNGLATDSSGNLYVAGGELNVITKIAPDGTVAPSPYAAGLSTPIGLAFDKAGNLYAANYGNGTISRITPAGRVSTFASGMSEPVGLAFDAAGNLYVSCFGDNSIYEVAPNGSVTGFFSKLNQPAGMVFDAAGNLYVANSGNGSIAEISPGGAYSILGSVGNNSPTGLALDGAGNLYAADSYDDVVSMITAQGAVSTFVGDGLSTPVFIVTVPVLAPAFVVQPAGQSVSRGQAVTLVAAATGLPAYQWSLGGSPIPGATGATLTLADAQPSDSGTYTVTATNAAGTATSSPVTVTVLAPPVFTVLPVSVTVSSGRTAAFSAAVTGSPAPSYQWSLNGSPLTGATDPVLLVSGATANSSGIYRCTATNTSGIASASAMLTVDTGSAPGYLANISARAYVGTGGNMLIGGFSVVGTGSKQLLIRGVGPGLNAVASLTGYVPDPILSLFNSAQAQLCQNDNWGTPCDASAASPSVLAAAFNLLGAFSLSSGSLDSSLLVSLPVSALAGFTAECSSQAGRDGTGLVEIYDADQGVPATRVVNLSARAFVRTGQDILDGGFVIGGSTAETVLIRGVGPGLASLGVPGSLAQPILTVFLGARPIYSNTAWGGDPVLASVANSVGAFRLDPSQKDSVLLITLPPGAYTAQVTGVGNGTGIALFEIYEVQ